MNVNTVAAKCDINIFCSSQSGENYINFGLCKISKAVKDNGLILKEVLILKAFGNKGEKVGIVKNNSVKR